MIDCQIGTFGLPFEVNLKLESLQYTGSFKVRGAFNNLLNTKNTDTEYTAASGGNHGAAVAYATKKLGFKSRIFVPETSSPVKIDRIKSYGSEVVVNGRNYADAALNCEAFQRKSGAVNIHPFNTDITIAGQGTIGLEWENQVSDLDVVLIAVGGGGLIAGITSWFGKKVKVVGVEPKGCSSLFTALRMGGPTDVEIDSIAADSLGAKSIGSLPFTTVSESIDQVVLVEDADIVRAQKFLWKELQVAAEPGGAVSLAALMSGAFKPKASEKVGVLVCGGNVNLGKLDKIITN